MNEKKEIYVDKMSVNVFKARCVDVLSEMNLIDAHSFIDALSAYLDDTDEQSKSYYQFAIDCVKAYTGEEISHGN